MIISDHFCYAPYIGVPNILVRSGYERISTPPHGASSNLQLWWHKDENKVLITIGLLDPVHLRITADYSSIAASYMSDVRLNINDDNIKEYTLVSPVSRYKTASKCFCRAQAELLDSMVDNTEFANHANDDTELALISEKAFQAIKSYVSAAYELVDLYTDRAIQKVELEKLPVL